VLTAAIVGRAWRTPLGNTIESAMARLHAGERAAMTDPRGGYACTTIAPIRDEPARSRNSRFLRRMGLFGLEVAIEALGASGVARGARTGLFSGVGGLRAHWDDMIAGFANQRDDGERMWERGLCNVHPYWMLRHLSNNVHALASAELDLRGEGATFGGANGGAQALASAIRAIHDGAIDAAVIVAYDSLLEPETLVELAARGGATLASLDALVAPYTPGANGFVPGEAAAALVLVRERDGAPTIAVRDAAGPDALARCLALATNDATGDASGDTAAAINARDIGLVDGVAHGSPDRDRAERALLDTLEQPVQLTAITAAMGQLGAATSVVQAIALSEMLRAGTASPIAGHAGATTVNIGTRMALGLSAGAPELAAAIRIEVPA
jgi:3-oxoacyl-[acyl-carrier-protein] synthase II